MVAGLQFDNSAGMPVHQSTVPVLFRQFVDDELLRAPMTMDMVLQGAIESFQRSPALASPSERQMAGELMLRLASYRPRVVDRYVASLRDQVNAELAGQRHLGGTNAVGTELSLIDDDEVSVDVVISHVMQAVRSVAEHELRELLAFTSALAGDMDVGADHNPFRADVQARALWAAAQALPQSRGHQVAFMRYAAMPFALALRKSFAAACARLETQGVVPAVYRTLIPPSGPRRGRSLGQERLNRSDDLFETVATATRPLPGPQAALHNGSAGLQSQLFERVGRLFAAMMDDRQLLTELHAPISRMQSFVMQMAASDPAVLDSPHHAVWRFMDAFVHMASVYSGVDRAEQAQTLRFSSLLLDQLGDELRHTEPLYQWAIDRVERYGANRLAARCAAVEYQIKTMQALEDRLGRDAPVSTFHGALDAAQLDTVPAELMDLKKDSAQVSSDTVNEWLSRRRPGQWMCVFRKGGWTNAQLLWPGERGEIFLFGDADAALTSAWAIRRSALWRLRREGLIELFEARSLLLDALERLSRRSGALRK